MCTLTWFHTDDGYELVFNRDEQRTRGPEVRAAETVIDGVRVLAPRDADFGGTWIAVNQHGVSVALLNGYVASRGPVRKDAQSRGRLVLSVAGAESAARAIALAEESDLGRYQPFVLAAFDARPGFDSKGTTRIARWDGRELVQATDETPPLISSGVALDRVRAHRGEVYAALVSESGGASSEVLRAFHESHVGGPSELSTCMHREDAETRSSCSVEVREGEVRMTHTQGSPCRTRRPAPLCLLRRSTVSAG